MNFVLIDTHWQELLPLTFTRPASHLLVGIDRIYDKWERHLGQTPAVMTAEYLQRKFPVVLEENNLLINSTIIPTTELVDSILNLPEGKVLSHLGQFVAAHCDRKTCADLAFKIGKSVSLKVSDFVSEEVGFAGNLIKMLQPSDLFSHNDAVLRKDFEEITKGYRTSSPPPDVRVKGKDLFIHKDAVLNHCIINTETGPVYIGPYAEIMEGTLIRGPVSIGAHSVVKMGAKIYGASSFGAYCRIGGEISNSVMHDYSNKGHDGFLGNSVVGSWCNLGADTNTSNLKNNYGPVRVWNYPSHSFRDSGLQFHGLIMGDHAKASINTMFNTGSVVGVCTNVFEGGFPPKFLPSFTWASSEKHETFKIEKAFEAARAMMQRREVEFDSEDEAIFNQIFRFDEEMRQFNH